MVKLDLLTDIDLNNGKMVEKGKRAGIFHYIHIYVIANNKYMKDFDKNIESSDVQYWDINNLYG